MIYTIILGKTQVNIDEEDKAKVISNIDKSFIVLKSGEVINPSFVQGIVIDHEASRQKIKNIKMSEDLGLISQREKMIEGSLAKFKPDFLK